MARFRTLNRLALVFVVLTLTLLSGSQPNPKNPLPATKSPNNNQPTVDSLPLQFQYALSRDLGRDDRAFHFSQQGDSYQVANPRSGLYAMFDYSGLQVRSGEHTWSLALSAWGREGAMQALPAASSIEVETNQLTYLHGPLSEWLLNGPLGLQQGWHIPRPPTVDTDKPVTLALTLGGDLRAVAHHDKRSLALVDSSGFSALTYGGLMAYDATGSELNAWFETHDEQLLVFVADAGAVYPLTVDPWLQVSKLTTATAQDDDLLGYSLAVSADGGTVVAGAPRIDQATHLAASTSTSAPESRLPPTCTAPN